MRIISVMYILLCFSFLYAQKNELIAVFTFKSVGIDTDKSFIILDSLRSEINRNKKLEVMDYQIMNKILKYKGIEEDDVCDTLDCASVMGEFLAVEKIIQGSIVKKDNRYSLNVRFVNLSKSENILDTTETYTGSFEGLLSEVVPNISKMIIRSATKEIRKKRGAFIALIGGLGIAAAVPVALLIRPKRNEPGLAKITIIWTDLIEE